MPLIDVTFRDGFSLVDAIGREVGSAVTEEIVFGKFGPWLPAIFVNNRIRFGLDESTPKSAVQVQFHTFGEHDINVPDLWVKVQFSENLSSAEKGIDIRNAIYSELNNLFHHTFGIPMPDNFALDLLWGPTHGCIWSNGELITW